MTDNREHPLTRRAAGREHDDQVSVFQVDDLEQGVSTDVVLAVAEVSGSDHTELQPLNEVINVDALDRLFTQRTPDNENKRVSFSYQGFQVTVYADGEILLWPQDGNDA